MLSKWSQLNVEQTLDCDVDWVTYCSTALLFCYCRYGLLGASGCGKTTLLSCIVGRRKLNSGDIWVLGGKPGSKGSGVPGPRIGYMPQVHTYIYVRTTHVG
jgi:ABC-type transport system involved in cytochrome bd biosynthesis fused ATPase/permease subunit